MRRWIATFSMLCACAASQVYAARVGFIDATLNLQVPRDYPSIEAALAALDGQVISSSAWVNIRVADGIYQLNNAIVINHNDGDRIRIYGNQADPQRVQLRINNKIGLSIAKGKSLGLLDGFLLVGLSTDAGGYGIVATMGGNAVIGANTIVRGFHIGVYAASHATINFQGKVAASTTHGIAAVQNALILANNAESAQNGNNGFFANLGATIIANNAISRGNSLNGYLARQNASILAPNSRAVNNGTFGYQAETGGQIAATGNVIAQGNGRGNFEPEYGLSQDGGFVKR